MSYYAAGTITLTSGSATVTGSGTDFIANVRPGDVLIGPAGTALAIDAVVSATELTLARNYGGSTQTSGEYEILHTQGVTHKFNASATELLSYASTMSSPAGLKATYESNPDTNALTDRHVAQLQAVAAEFKTPALALADSLMRYSGATGSQFVVSAGEYVRAGGVIYHVADAAASDHHVTTVGGVKLYVQPTAGMMDIRAFGATGGADDTAAIAAALATGADVFIPAGEWICSAISPSADRQTIAGVGLSSVLKFKLGEIGVLFDSDGHPVTIRDLDLDGQENSGKTSVALDEPGEGDADDRTGLALDFDTDTKVINVNVHGFGNRGLRPRNALGYRNAGFEVIGGKFSLNWCNVDVGPGTGEYGRFSNVSMVSGQVGLLIPAGNTTFVGCTINDNYDNVRLIGGETDNNGHGSMVSCLLNHATNRAILAQDVDIGYVFSACQIFYGTIEIDNCDGIAILGGQIDVAAIIVSDCGAGRIEGHFCDAALDNTLTISSSPKFIVRDVYKSDGAQIAQGMTTLGDSNYTPGDIGVLRLGENGGPENYGFEFSTSGASGDMILWAVGSTAAGAGNRDATPVLKASRVSGKITALTVSLTSAADDTAAAAAGVPVGGLYQNAGAVRQRLT